MWFIQRAAIGSSVLSCVIFIEINCRLSSSKANIPAFDGCIYNSLRHSWLPLAALVEIEAVLFNYMNINITLISDFSLKCALIDLSCRYDAIFSIKQYSLTFGRCIYQLRLASPDFTIISEVIVVGGG
jgi:hypothetical protein